jgi:Ca-activated chloride channel family protein
MIEFPPPLTTRSSKRNRRIARRRGAMLYLILLFIVIFLGLAALSVDVAYMHLTRTQLRAATDAAARAGGEALSRLQNTNAARAAAKQLAAANFVAGEPLQLADSDIVFGFSDKLEDGSWEFTAGATPTNSLQVLGRRTDDSLSGPVGLFFGRVFGVNTFQPVQSATAVKLDRDICLVLDRSSSMKLSLSSSAETMSTSDPRFSQPPQYPDSRWAAATAAVDVFVDTLATTPPNEQCALVTFSSNGTWVNVSNTASSLDQQLTSTASAVKAAGHSFDTKIFNGMTTTSAGLNSAVEELTHPTRARPYARKTIVFLTDGFRTAGADPVPIANAAAAQDIVIHTITFGATFDQSEMIAVANATKGKHYHAPNAQTLSDVFREIASSSDVILTQ